MPDEKRGRFRLRRVSARQAAAIAAVWLAVMAAAVGIAIGLDRPVGGGARDRAMPIVAGPVVAPGAELTASAEGLPPIALVLPQSLPAAIATLPPEEQVARLRERADALPGPRRLSELGSALQATGDTPSAEEAYRGALGIEADYLAARIGLVMTDAASGSDGLDRAARAFARLARERPREQIVAFNQGWLAIYRRDPATAGAAWSRTVALGGETRLGRTATQLLRALRAGGAQSP